MAKQKSQRFLNEIHFRKLRRATFARPFIAIVSRLPRNIAKLACGGNVRNSANTCQASRSKTSAKLDIFREPRRSAKRNVTSTRNGSQSETAKGSVEGGSDRG